MAAQILGPYEIVESLGRGPMGEVWLALDTRSGRHVALKQPSEAWLAQPDADRLLRDEAQAALDVRHPQLATIRDVVDLDGRPYVVVDYVEGRPLDAILAEGRLPLERALVIAVDVTEAMAAAHTGGIVHGDLKPANVRVRPDGRAVVLDLGIAKVRPASPETDVPRPIAGSLSEEPRFLGTPGYAAPEQVTGRSIDRRCDLYAIGVMLFEMVTGRRPFVGGDASEVALATITEPVPPIRRFSSDVTPALEAIVTQALAKNPKERYQTAPQLAGDLRQALREIGERPAVPLEEQWALANPTAHRPQAHAWRLLLIAAVVVFVLIAAAVLIRW